MDTPSGESTPSARPKLYSFEEIHGRAGHRDRQKARAQLEVLWSRLGGQEGQLATLRTQDPQGWQFLMRYVADGPLSIQWYDDKRPELEAKQRRYNRMLMGVALLLFILAFALPFQPLLLTLFDRDLPLAEAAGQTGLVDVAALMGVVGTGATVALRISAQAVRYRRQAAVFHKASAGLKEQLYRLEGDWAPRQLLGSEKEPLRLHPEFTDALRLAIGEAQRVLAEERDAYFDTLTVDVNALTDNTTRAAQDLGNLSVLRTEHRKELAQARRELDRQIADASLAIRTANAKIAELESQQQTAPDDLKMDLQSSLHEERLALREAEQLYEHLVEQRNRALG